MKIKVGSRTSNLALWQAERIAELLEAVSPEIDVEIIGMETIGDRIRDKAIPEIGGKGLFTEELEQGLLAEEIDLAVHSLKDLPTRLPDGLIYAGSPARANPTDAFVSLTHQTLSEVPDDGVIATGSLRRRAQVAQQLPGVNFLDLRGNIGTRLDKLRDHGEDGIIMETAARTGRLPGGDRGGGQRDADGCSRSDRAHLRRGDCPGLHGRTGLHA